MAASSTPDLKSVNEIPKAAGNVDRDSDHVGAEQDVVSVLHAPCEIRA
jgi:hypothetical protein